MKSLIQVPLSIHHWRFLKKASQAFNRGGTPILGICSLVEEMVEICPPRRVVTMAMQKAFDELGGAGSPVCASIMDLRMGINVLHRSPVWEMLTKDNRNCLAEVVLPLLGDLIDFQVYLLRDLQKSKFANVN